MDPVAIVVLIIAAITTLWLVIYVKVMLPQKFEARFADSLKAFSTAIELRFPIFDGMTKEVASLSAEVGENLGLSLHRMQDLALSCELRDIGMCAIPYHLVNYRSMSTWTLAEKMTFDCHPEVSGAMLELVPSLRHLADIVRCHHAPFDASSGMDLPGGKHIPVEARILKVVSEYLWVRRQQGEFLAWEEIRSQVGKQYCPEVVQALEAVLTSKRVDNYETRLATTS